MIQTQHNDVFTGIETSYTINPINVILKEYVKSFPCTKSIIQRIKLNPEYTKEVIIRMVEIELKNRAWNTGVYLNSVLNSISLFVGFDFTYDMFVYHIINTDFKEIN